MTSSAIKPGAGGALITTLAAACIGVSAAPAGAHVGKLTVRLPAHVLVAAKQGAPGARVRGTLSFALPAGWRATAATEHGTVGNIALPLSATCTATIEVNTWVEIPERPIGAEIEDDLAFWFYAHGKPIAPPRNPEAASGKSARRRWVLGTPPPGSRTPLSGEPAPTIASPFMGDLYVRLRGNNWGYARLGARTTPSCAAALAPGSPLQTGLVRILRTAAFSARIG